MPMNVFVCQYFQFVVSISYAIWGDLVVPGRGSGASVMIHGTNRGLAAVGLEIRSMFAMYSRVSLM
jgi:hypothetical protein